MIKINETIPEFSAKAFQDNKIKNISLKELRGKWVVLFFYPGDFTFVCPTELEELADNYEKFKEINTEVLSVSTDSEFVHKAWHDQSPTIRKVQYPMLADPSGKLSRLFGTYIDEEGVALRGTFVINPEGILKAYEMHDNSIGRSANELIRKVEAAQFVEQHGGEVCPASWTKGKATLKPGLDLVGKI